MNGLMEKGNGTCTEPGSVSDLTPSSGSLTIACAVDDKRRNSKSRSKKCFERVVIGVVIATVWILLALPIALYHLPQVRRHQKFCLISRD